jgi:alpha-beta hydrolase superfamily lysophospholipase
MRWGTRFAGGCALTAALACAGGAAAVAGPGTVPAVDREVRFVADGVTSYGTVHVPAHRPGARLAAALLIPGSGPTDRDGDEPGFAPATLRLIADALGADGVLTVRFDKYFTGETGRGSWQLSEIDMAAYEREAVAAYNAMAAQPETDPHALLVVGHSEGGLRASQVAADARVAPAGLALLAPQDLRLLDMVRYQLDAMIDKAVAGGNYDAAQGRTNKAVLDRLIADFRAARPLDYSGMTPALASSLRTTIFVPQQEKFVRTDDAIYPPDVARNVARGTHVLLTCGTADSQVPCWTTAPLLASLARAGTAGPGPRVLPRVDHFLHPAGTDPRARILAPAVLRALHDFARR